MQSTESQASELNISLANLLNILWRHRWLVIGVPLLGLIAGIVYGQVVTPLYLATATVRPGITAFTPAGGGAREWRLKDITRWYESRLYEVGLAQEMGIERSEVPMIRSDFILRGLQNIQGGDIITLTVMDPSPERAERVLDASIEAFAEYAVSDTLSNSIALTSRGLEIQIAELRRQQDSLQERHERLSADIALAQAESLQIDTQIEQMESAIERVEVQNEQVRSQIETRTALLDQLQGRLASLDDAIQTARRRADISDGSDAAPEGVRPQALLTETEVYRGLLNSSVTLQDRIAEVQGEISALRQTLGENEVQIAELRTEMKNKIALERAEITHKLRGLRIDQEREVPQQRRALDLQIREKKAQLAMLSPIERVGSIVATEQPVRPRKKRATLILTFLGLVGGITLAFVWDYVAHHRREIFAR